MSPDCLEYEVMSRFFHEEHLISKHEGEEERVKFLKPPSWHGGGRVPKDALYREDNKFLLRIEMIPAVDILYAALAKVKTLAKTKYDENVGIRLILKVLHACGRRGIPQNYVPGIVLLYSEHCEGCPWRHLVSRILHEKQMALRYVEHMRNRGKEEEAKLGPNDWPEYMVSAVADFLRVPPRRSAQMRLHA